MVAPKSASLALVNQIGQQNAKGYVCPQFVPLRTLDCWETWERSWVMAMLTNKKNEVLIYATL